jgi:hypothetical protein
MRFEDYQSGLTVLQVGLGRPLSKVTGTTISPEPFRELGDPFNWKCLVQLDKGGTKILPLNRLKLQAPASVSDCQNPC